MRSVQGSIAFRVWCNTPQQRVPRTASPVRIHFLLRNGRGMFVTLMMLTAFTLPALAASLQTGQVTTIIVRARDGLIYLYVSGTATGHPPCATGGYWMIKDENSNAGKQQLPVLIAAQAANRTVTLTGMNTCARWVNGENIESVFLSDQ